MELTFPCFDELEIKNVEECLKSKWVTQGPFVKRFQEDFKARHQVAHALATTSCTAALHLSTLALGLKPGDEMICPAFTWVTSAHAAEYTGATVKFVDVDPLTFNIDPKLIEAAITPRTKAIMVIHLFGLAADMDAINAIARKHNLYVIEDAACAVGTTYKGVPVGSFGTLGCFSFHPRKVITTGEGGMVTTQDSAIAEKVASFLNHGATGLPSEHHEEHGPWTMATFANLGFNLRLSDIQASVGLAQLKKLDTLLAERKALAENYQRLLEPIEGIICPKKEDGHTYQSFVLRLKDADRKQRNAVMKYLTEHKISTRPGTHAVHRLHYYQEKYKIKPEAFPNAVLCEDTTITIPLFPGMTHEDQVTVVTALKSGIELVRS
jgi:perosamine synthetase